jgi:quinol-cytochrome oxidoreductase complex cytochrome b subunit
MTTKQELAMLNEIRRIYWNCPEQVAKYAQRRWVATGIAWILIFVAFLLTTAGMLNATFSLVIAVLGGISMGISLLFTSSAKQMPLVVRYTTLLDEEVEKRLAELKGN